MGQRNGKAAYEEGCIPFLNLSFAALERLWEAFNDVADGFGVSQYEMEEICSELMDELSVNRTKMNEYTGMLFRLLDTDKNDLVDALEFLAATAIVSGMRTRDTLEFVLNAYDFDGSQELSIDEMTLAMKSTLTGLCKLSGERMPREEQLEIKAMNCFEAIAGSDPDGNGGTGGGKVYIGQIIEWAADDPELRSWLDYYDDAAEQHWIVYPMKRHELDFEFEGFHAARSSAEAADMECNPFVFTESSDAKMSKQGWVAAIASLQPSEHGETRLDPSLPDAGLELEWVHGFRSEDCKSNVRYTATGEMLWHTSRIGVVYNENTSKQRFYMGHSYEIVSFALHPNKHLVATGEAGPKPCITIWDTESLEAVSTIRGFHEQSVEQLAFSADGSKLAGVGGDEEHQMSIYLWEQRRRIFSGKCGPRKVLDCCFGDADSVVTCGVNHINFWVKDGTTITRRRGIFGQNGKVQALTCLTPCGANMLSGTVSGHIYVWLGRNCMRAIRAHGGCVNTLFTSPHGIVSGGKDKKVKLWTLSLEPGSTFDMSAFGSSPSVRSACLSQDGTKVLVGTKGSDVFQISAADGSDESGGPVTSGHFAGKVRGIAVHPMKEEYATVGDDATLRIWDIGSRNLIKSTVFDTGLTCVAYHPNGDVIVVGMGGPVGGQPYGAKKTVRTKKDGAFAILNEPDLTLNHDARDSKQPLTACGYSPNGEYMAVASEDSCIYLYSTEEDYESIGRCRRHTGPVRRFDFSEDSKYLQSIGDDGNLYFFNAGTAQSMSNLSAMKDVKFPKQSCVYGWGTSGAFSSRDDGSEVLATCRSQSSNVLCVGDNFGNVKLFRYPSCAKGAAFHEFRAHSGPIADISFFRDNTVISLGASDRSIMQWRYHEDDKIDDAPVLDEQESDDYAMELRDGSDLEAEEAVEAAIDRCEDLAIRLEESAAPEDFEANNTQMLPWMENIAEPSNIPMSNKAVPADAFQLEWIHGYRAQDCRQNLFYVASGKIVYPAANAMVRLDTIAWQQKFMLEHNDGILAVSVSPDGKLVASASQGRRPTIVVWDAETMRVQQVLKGLHQRAVVALNWSPDGRLLASVGCDDDHTLAIYDWKDNLLLAKARTSKRKVFSVAFGCLGERLVTVGVKHIGFWQLHRGGRHLKYSKGLITASKGKLQAFMCAVWLNDTAVVGSGDGHFYVFEPENGEPSRQLKVTKKAHDDMVNALCVYSKGLVSGGKDGMVKVWTRELLPVVEHDIRNCSPCLYPRVRSVDVSPDGKMILLGSQGGEIFEMDIIDGKSVHEAGPLVQSHFRGALRGLAVHPTEPEFATIGDDNTLRVWSINDMKIKTTKELDSPGRALSYSHDGRLLAAGLGAGLAKAQNDGKYMIFESTSLSVIHEGREAQEWVRFLSFSPDNKRLAVGHQDNTIVLCDATDGFVRSATITCHQAPVMALDWSSDSMYTVSIDEAYNMQFADATSGVQIPVAAALKDSKWSTQTCWLGWAVQGIQPDKYTKATIAACDRSRKAARNGQHLLAVADSFGRFKVYHTPTYEKDHGFSLHRGHSGALGNIKWATEDTHLLTVGADDRCVFQWRCLPDDAVQEGDQAGDSGEDSEVERDTGLSSVQMLGDYEKAAAEVFSAVKPWVNNIVPPSKVPEEISERPPLDLELDFAHGVRCGDVRNAVRYNCRGGVVFPSAALGVIYDAGMHAQFFHTGHRGDIISMAMSASKLVVATGDCGKAPVVRLWDALTGKLLMELPRLHERGVSQLAFSADEKWLASVGQDCNHTIATYFSPTGFWHDGVRVAVVNGPKAKILGAAFAGKEAFPLMICGVKCVEFLEPNGATLVRRQGIFGKRKKIQPMLCCEYLNDDTMVCGTVTGHIFSWNKKDLKCEKLTRAHEGPVYAMARDGPGLVTGGKDGFIMSWDANLKKVQTFSILDVSPQPLSSAIHSICVDPLRMKWLVGMKSGDVYEVVKDTNVSMLLNEGHAVREIHALATHPIDADRFATSGDDGAIRIWSAKERKVLFRSSPDLTGCGIRSLEWSPDGSALLCGCGGDPDNATKDGALLVVEIAAGSNQIEIKHEDRKAKKIVNDIKFSPDGTSFAVASDDGRVYIHEASDYSLRTVCAKSPSPVKTMDWSTNGKYLQGVTRAMDLVYYDVTNGKPLSTPAIVRDAEWYTTTVPVGFSVQGIWPQIDDGFDIQTVHRSKSGRLLAKGDDDGRVSVSYFPCTHEKECIQALGGHATHITKVRFTADDQYLVSIGGFNRSVIQYKLKRLGVDENGVSVVVLPDMDVPPMPPTGAGGSKASHGEDVKGR